MRRTKEEVAPELPAKTVIDELVPLEGAQAALYESIRTAMDKRIREAIAARGLAASRIAVLDALLKLRQVCCGSGPGEARRRPQGERERQAGAPHGPARSSCLAEGRTNPVLVFSQFVKMLKLVERGVAARGWGYGHAAWCNEGTATPRSPHSSRGTVPLFLVSLKAGGHGRLNLWKAGRRTGKGKRWGGRPSRRHRDVSGWRCC